MSAAASFSTRTASGAARERLDPGRAAAGEEVEEPGTRQVRAQDPEDRLLHAVVERPRPGAGHEAAARGRPATTRPASAIGCSIRRRA